MSTMKKIVAFAMALAMCAVCFAGCGAKTNNYAAENTEFFIGGTGPLTGDASSYGISVQEGAQIAIDEINANGGLNGYTFKFDIKDDKATAADAATGYDTLYEAGMQASIGSVTSGSCDSFASKADEDKLFAITPSASAANVIENRPTVFRVCFGDPDQGYLAAEELSANFEVIGAIYDTSDPYSSGIYEAFAAKMAELNVEFNTQTFDAENKKDFSTQVEALKDCDVIFLPIYYTEAGTIAKTAAAKGCDALLFGCDGLDGIAGQLDESVTSEIRYITPFDAASTDETVVKFVNAYTAKYNRTPDQFAADGYDAVMAIFEAMKKANVSDVTISAQELCDILVSTITADDFLLKGATGEMTWDESGACTKVPQIVVLNSNK
ncbi:MAG: ABC transporter substrate-binding protein [Clostridia bacterium]|nr:ABC transporter substrate-binding protein [Clostridia bacterium]